MKESQVHSKLCKYIATAYPDVLFSSDVGSGVNLTMGQGSKFAKLRSDKGFPDLMVFEARHGYHGQFIELKADNASPYLKDGSGLKKNEHTEHQAKMLEALRIKGYKADFGVGLEHSTQLIDSYLG